MSQTTLKHWHSRCSFPRAEVWWVEFCSHLGHYCFPTSLMVPSWLDPGSVRLLTELRWDGSRACPDFGTAPLSSWPLVDGGGWFQEGEVEWESWQMMWGESRTVKMITVGRGRASRLWLARPAFACWHWEAKQSRWGKATGGRGWGGWALKLEKKKASQQGRAQFLYVWGGMCPSMENWSAFKATGCKVKLHICIVLFVIIWSIYITWCDIKDLFPEEDLFPEYLLEGL